MCKRALAVAATILHVYKGTNIIVLVCERVRKDLNPTSKVLGLTMILDGVSHLDLAIVPVLGLVTLDPSLLRLVALAVDRPGSTISVFKQPPAASHSKKQVFRKKSCSTLPQILLHAATTNGNDCDVATPVTRVSVSLSVEN